MIRKKWLPPLRIIGSAFEMTLRQNVYDSFIIFGVIVQPIIIALLALWMLQDQASSQAIYVIIGSGMTGLWTSLLFISGNSLNQERRRGTLETLVCLPTPLPLIIFGKNLANVVQSMSSMIVSYSLATLLFGLGLEISYPWAFVISLLLTVLSFVSFGLIISPIFLMDPGIQGWQNAMEFPVYILCGFLFPIALLPGWTTPFSYVLPPYWAARALHSATTKGSNLSEFALCWGMMFLLSALIGFIANKLFLRVLYKVRNDGTLGLQ